MSTLLPFELLISSWNVNGLRRILKDDKNDLTSYTNDSKPDILFVQETKIEHLETEETLSHAIDNYKGYFNSLNNKSSGLGVYIKDSFTHELENNNIKIEVYSLKKSIDLPDREIFKGRIITVEFPKFYIVNTYVLHSGMKLEKLENRAKWDENLLLYLQELQKEKYVIWCGDLNVANEDIDLTNPKSNRNKTAGFTDQERDSFKMMLVKADLIDLYRYSNPDNRKYTFWSWLRKENRDKNIGWRLDYVIISRSLLSLIDKDNIKSIIRDDILGSDHCPVEVVLSY